MKPNTSCPHYESGTCVWTSVRLGVKSAATGPRCSVHCIGKGGPGNAEFTRFMFKSDYEGFYREITEKTEQRLSLPQDYGVNPLWPEVRRAMSGFLETFADNVRAVRLTGSGMFVNRPYYKDIDVVVYVHDLKWAILSGMTWFAFPRVNGTPLDVFIKASPSAFSSDFDPETKTLYRYPWVHYRPGKGTDPAVRVVEYPDDPELRALVTEFRRTRQKRTLALPQYEIVAGKNARVSHVCDGCGFSGGRFSKGGDVFPQFVMCVMCSCPAHTIDVINGRCPLGQHADGEPVPGAVSPSWGVACDLTTREVIRVR